MIKWSNLQVIAQSKAAGLTVLIPLVGLFIVFNDLAFKYFQLNKVFLKDVGVTDPGSVPSAEKTFESASMIRLYLLYFGLSFVGVGTFIFKSLCPEQIKKYPGSDDFYQYESKLPPCDRLRESVYVSKLNNIASNSSLYFMTPTRRRLKERFSALFDRMKRDTIIMNDLGENGLRDARRFSDTWSKYFLSSSHTEQHQKQAVSEYSYELLISEYLIIDRSKIVARIIVSVFLYFGLLLLAIPTIQAFIKISSRVYENSDRILPFIFRI